ncbi:MAG: hypothetical protein HY815_05295 [Candidatus Riflebacteria bacterium]|nr:hypothetical protein [Candidatus Riflebacteria bacterium]
MDTERCTVVKGTGPKDQKPDEKKPEEIKDTDLDKVVGGAIGRRGRVGCGSCECGSEDCTPSAQVAGIDEFAPKL